MALVVNVKETRQVGELDVNGLRQVEISFGNELANVVAQSERVEPLLNVGQLSEIRPIRIYIRGLSKNWDKISFQVN